MHRISTLIISLLVSVCATAAPLARVQSIKNGRTLILAGGLEVRLAGIEITNEVAACDLLRWTVGSSWVMVERDAAGGARVYRSPDAMFVNRELVLRGYARATEPGIEPEARIQATYLGLVNPGPRGRESATVNRPEARTRNGTSGRSSAPRATRPRRNPRAGSSGRSASP